MGSPVLRADAERNRCQLMSAALAVFAERGLACAPCGEFEEGHVLRLTAGSSSVEVWDLMRDRLTRPAAGERCAGRSGRAPS